MIVPTVGFTSVHTRPTASTAAAGASHCQRSHSLHIRPCDRFGPGGRRLCLDARERRKHALAPGARGKVLLTARAFGVVERAVEIAGDDVGAGTPGVRGSAVPLQQRGRELRERLVPVNPVRHNALLSFERRAGPVLHEPPQPG